MQKIILIVALAMFFAGCAEIEPKPFEPSTGHIQPEEKPAGEIPELVQEAPPVLPAPLPPVEQEKYTVVVNEVPVKELLFALARDAKVNVDIDPRIDGVVTINAVDQTLPQILDRIANQVDLRFEFKGDNLLIQPDEPYLRTYKINYINMSRDTNSSVTIATQISTTGAGFEAGGGGASAGGGGGNNNSTTDVKNAAVNHFWESLVKNVQAIIEQDLGQGGGAGIPVTTSVIPSPETGILTVRATSHQHEHVQKFIDQALESANRQVMIQATIVEVNLSDQYQAGIDWSFLSHAAGIAIDSFTLPAAPAGTITNLVFDYLDNEPSDADQISLTVRLLNEFGDVRVLSSPQLMVLNSQTAILKVVENNVFFTIDTETNTTQGVVTNSFESIIHTVPVGVVMGVTPQINDNDSIILNVRPTISRVGDEVQDPNPALRTVGGGQIANLIPEIQVREMESLLRLNNGQVAVLGGLMQDETRNGVNNIPGFSDLPLVGKGFETKTKEYFKTELVIFLRPIIVRNPSLDGDLQLYKTFLERQPATPGSVGAPTP